jgi:hypothetical protein
MDEQQPLTPIFNQYEMCISVEESIFLERQGNHLLTTTPHITLPSSNGKYPPCSSSSPGPSNPQLALLDRSVPGVKILTPF